MFGHSFVSDDDSSCIETINTIFLSSSLLISYDFSLEDWVVQRSHDKEPGRRYLSFFFLFLSFDRTNSCNHFPKLSSGDLASRSTVLEFFFTALLPCPWGDFRKFYVFVFGTSVFSSVTCWVWEVNLLPVWRIVWSLKSCWFDWKLCVSHP